MHIRESRAYKCANKMKHVSLDKNCHERFSCHPLIPKAVGYTHTAHYFQCVFHTFFWPLTLETVNSMHDILTRS